jgi:hypothetical protein
MGRSMLPFLGIQRREVGPNSAVVGILFGTELPFLPRSLRVSHPVEEGSQPHAGTGEVRILHEDLFRVSEGFARHIEIHMCLSEFEP